MTPEAMGELYEAERGPLTRSIERLVGDRHAAEDLVHDSFVAYLAHEPGADRPGAWLSRVARNRALNHLRRATPLPLTESPAHAADEGALTEGGPEREAVQAVVAGALGALHDRDRLALQLRFFEGLDYQEVATRLGARVEQTHVIVHRAVRRLGREVVRRLANAHGAAACEDALAGMIGLATVDQGHATEPCTLCRPAWDEIGALRSLPALAPLAVGPGTLRRMIGRIWTRAAGLADFSPLTTNVAGAMVGVAVVVSSVAPGGAVATARPAAKPVAVRVAAPSGGTVAPARAAATTTNTGSSSTTTPAKLNPAGTNTDVGGVSMTDRGDHQQVEAPQTEDGGSGTGIVICKPLEPCPPPPSPGAGP